MNGILNKDYRDMVECLQREGVEFMLVGGYAVALYGFWTPERHRGRDDA